MEDQHSGISLTEANLKRLRDDWKIELHQTIAALRDELETRLQAASQETNAGWFVRRIEALERENLSLRLERDRAIAQPGHGSNRDALAEEILKLKAQNESLERDLRQAHAKLDGFRQLLNGDNESNHAEFSLAAPANDQDIESDSQPEDGLSHNSFPSDAPQKSSPSEPTSTSSALTSSALPSATVQTTPQTSSSEVNRSSVGEVREASSTPKARGPKAGRAFNRAEAIFLAVKDWNRLNPSETFIINPGVLETVFHVHRQAAKDFFAAYQNELWDYHQELNVESPRWHNRGKDMEKLKAFVDERLGVE
jgi:hypothetical protein